MNNFKYQLGGKGNDTFLSEPQRLAQLKKLQNPFICGNSLEANSGVFVGRSVELLKILAALRTPNSPQSVSLVGERRIGKSSLLNQIFQALANDKNLISLHISTQQLEHLEPQHFFTGLYNSIILATGSDKTEEKATFTACKDLISALVEQHHYHFVLIIDEFEKMAANAEFNADFFSQLRGLGDSPDYRFAYVISSRRQLQTLCRQHKIDESNFWNIFGNNQVLGLLKEQEAKTLFFEPLNQSLSNPAIDEIKLWKTVQAYAGCHPLLIQMLGFELWQSLRHQYTIDNIQLKMSLRRYLEDWFYQRSIDSQQQWQMLVQAAAAQPIKKNKVFNDLVQRGLLLEDGRPFCPFFAAVIKEECEAIMQTSGAELETKLSDICTGLEKGVAFAGKLYETFKKGAVLSQDIQQEFGDI